MTEFAQVEPGNPQESAIAGEIIKAWARRDTIFVFPSQVSADSWAEASLKFPGIKAAEADRFIGWDSFFDRITRKNIPPDRKKSDQRTRLVWALAALEENSRRPFLNRLAKPGTPPQKSLGANLSKIAPTLRDIVSSLKNTEEERYAIEKFEELADYAALSDSYSRFLENHGFYETSALPVDPGEKGRYILFEPSLMPAYGSIAEKLGQNLHIETFSLRAPAEGSSGSHCSPDSRLILQKYSSFREELQWVFAACASLLDGGFQPADIAISIPGSTPDIKAHLRLVARQYCLPLDFRSGEPLAASAFGRLVNALSLGVSEGFSLRTMRRLFDKNAFGWKDEASALNLLRYASRYNIPEFSADRHYMSRLWKRTFSLCGDPEGKAEAFYNQLTKAGLAIAGAASFDALRRALHDFKDRFFEEPDPGADATKKLERLFEELDGLESAHSQSGRPSLAASPLEALLLTLEATLYRATGKSNAISVYPYHLAALLATPLHFVLDASQASLDAALGHFSLIPKELRARLGEGEEAVTLLESFNCVKALYCHADQSLSGYTVPHPYFSRVGALQLQVEADSVPQLPEAWESRAWRDSQASALPAFLPAGRIAAALGCFNAGDGNDGCLPPPALYAIACPEGPRPDPELLFSLPACDAKPFHKISPGKLKNLAECPFKWFLSCIPGIEGTSSAAVILAEGSLSHICIKELLQGSGTAEGIQAAFRRSLFQVLKSNGPALEPALEAAYPKIRNRVERILDFEEEFRARGWETGNFEVPLSRTYNDLSLVLQGRADRISGRLNETQEAGIPAPLVIIDYKKNSTPSKKDFLVNEEGELHDFQIACYAAMLEGEGFHVEQGFYWSIEAGKPVIVFGPGGARPDSQAFEPERKALLEALTLASGTIQEGAFLSIRPSGEACSSCTSRATCRAHFSSERP